VFVMTGPWNPLLDLHREHHGRAAARDEALRQYGFAVPTPDALAAIAAHAPSGVVELGAGTGYWARVLVGAGVDVVAYDLDPPPSPTSKWFAGTTPWHAIALGDERAVSAHPDRTLLLVWPTRGELWPAEAVERFHAAGGSTIAYVGEGPGGRCGDERFHALLGAIDHCYACEYGLVDAVCTCDAPRLWVEVESVAIPQWEGFEDRLAIYERLPAAAPRRRRRQMTRPDR
jgi:hypothetical protein